MSLSVSAPFGWRCLTSPRVRRTPAPPRRIPPAGGTLRSPSAAGRRGASLAGPGGLATTKGVRPDMRGQSLAALPSRPPQQRRGESAAPSLGSGCVVPTLHAVLCAAPTACPAPDDVGLSPSTSRLEAVPPPARLSRGAHTRYAGTRLSAHAIPATPEGPGGPWQLWRPAWHRPSPNVHRVGTLSLTLTGSCHNGRVLDNGMGGELG